MRRTSLLALLGASVLSAGLVTVGAAQGDDAAAVVPARAESSPSPNAAPPPVRPTTSPTSAATSPAPRVPTKAVPPTAPAAAPSPRPVAVRRTVITTGWRPYATAGPVVLHFPASVVEVVGLHESGHDGAQPQQPAADAGRIGTLESRERGTDGQGAADVVVDPSAEVRAPVTGTVLRGGTYTLYCDHVDEFVVVEPDARPGWEVKLLHVTGLRVGKGDRLQAGVTVVADGARTLPFDSQVDDHTVAPHWPHVHVEVVDPSVPDRPSGGSCD